MRPDAEAASSRSTTHTRSALDRFGGAGARTRSASTRATSIGSDTPSAAAARASASQKTGSSDTEVAWPATASERLTGPATPTPQYMCWPPFIDSVEPVTKPASSEHRKATPRAISSARPSRPTGILATILVITSGGTAATMSVSI